MSGASGDLWDIPGQTGMVGRYVPVESHVRIPLGAAITTLTAAWHYMNA